MYSSLFTHANNHIKNQNKTCGADNITFIIITLNSVYPTNESKKDIYTCTHANHSDFHTNVYVPAKEKQISQNAEANNEWTWDVLLSTVA